MRIWLFWPLRAPVHTPPLSQFSRPAHIYFFTATRTRTRRAGVCSAKSGAIQSRGLRQSVKSKMAPA